MNGIGNSTSNETYANSNDEGVLLRPPANSNFNDNRNISDNRTLSASVVSLGEVSWGAVLAGTLAAAATLMLLAILGIGLGMSSSSVFNGQGLDATTIGITSIIWLVIIQIIAYSTGGYLAGRLRTKSVSVHTNEVNFRDTAHGFLTWALSSLLCATLLASAIGSIVGGAAKMGGTIMTSAAMTGAATAGMAGAASAVDMDDIGNEIKSMTSTANPMKYLIGTLFRKDTATDASASTDSASSNTRNLNTRQTGPMDETAEVASIFMNNMNASALPAEDAKYLAQLVVEQTGLNQAQAEARVNSTFTQLQQKKTQAIATAKDTAEKARKTAAYSALSFFGFLLIGAISACLAATMGGKKRDI